jgi:hypothetical protein
MYWFSFNEFLTVMFFGACGLVYLLKKLASSSPDIADAAKKAATQKAISTIFKLLK